MTSSFSRNARRLAKRQKWPVAQRDRAPESGIDVIARPEESAGSSVDAICDGANGADISTTPPEAEAAAPLAGPGTHPEEAAAIVPFEPAEANVGGVVLSAHVDDVLAPPAVPSEPCAGASVFSKAALLKEIELAARATQEALQHEAALREALKRRKQQLLHDVIVYVQGNGYCIDDLIEALDLYQSQAKDESPTSDEEGPAADDEEEEVYEEGDDGEDDEAADSGEAPKKSDRNKRRWPFPCHKGWFYKNPNGREIWKATRRGRPPQWVRALMKDLSLPEQRMKFKEILHSRSSGARKELA